MYSVPNIGVEMKLLVKALIWIQGLKTNNAQLYSTNVNFQKLRLLETNTGDIEFLFNF